VKAVLCEELFPVGDALLLAVRSDRAK